MSHASRDPSLSGGGVAIAPAARPFVTGRREDAVDDARGHVQHGARGEAAPALLLVDGAADAAEGAAGVDLDASHEYEAGVEDDRGGPARDGGGGAVQEQVVRR